MLTWAGMEIHVYFGVCRTIPGLHFQGGLNSGVGAYLGSLSLCLVRMHLREGYLDMGTLISPVGELLWYSCGPQYCFLFLLWLRSTTNIAQRHDNKCVLPHVQDFKRMSPHKQWV
jgi:hypothetical protein